MLTKVINWVAAMFAAHPETSAKTTVLTVGILILILLLK